MGLGLAKNILQHCDRVAFLLLSHGASEGRVNAINKTLVPTTTATAIATATARRYLGG